MEMCPTTEVVEKRLNERANELVEYGNAVKTEIRAYATAANKNLLPQLNPRWLSAQTDMPRSNRDSVNSVIVDWALALTHRARAETRQYLAHKLSKDLCGSTAQRYFPNTCTSYKTVSAYGEVLSLERLADAVREDVFSLPACYAYQREVLRAESSEVDTAIDGYVVMAVLASLNKDANRIDHIPNLSLQMDSPTGEALAIGLVASRHACRGRPACKSPQDLVLQAIRNLARAPGADLASAIASLARMESSLTGQLDRAASATDYLSILLQVTRELGLTDVRTPEWLATDAATLRLVYVDVSEGNYYEAVLRLGNLGLCQRFLEDQGNAFYNRALRSSCRSLPLLTQLAETSGDDRSELIESYFSPLGAYRQKQLGSMFSFNAMVGYSAGMEELDIAGSGSRSTTGFYIPIALEYSTPLHWRWFGNGALGLTLADLGGVLSYADSQRVDSGRTSNASTLEFSSVVAPGAYLALGIRDTPFRTGISYQKAPELRKVSGVAGDTQADADRLMLFLTADIMMLGF
jgi:hypothetical protein